MNSDEELCRRTYDPPSHAFIHWHHSNKLRVDVDSQNPPNTNDEPRECISSDRIRTQNTARRWNEWESAWSFMMMMMMVVITATTSLTSPQFASKSDERPQILEMHTRIFRLILQWSFDTLTVVKPFVVIEWLPWYYLARSSLLVFVCSCSMKLFHSGTMSPLSEEWTPFEGTTRLSSHSDRIICLF